MINQQVEENMKRELKSRLALAGFFSETLQEIAGKSTKTLEGDEKASAKDLIKFIDAAR